MNEVLRVSNLVKHFGNFPAVDDISFSVQRGDIFGFLGTNGAGKTTTIRCITGLLNKTAGQIDLLNHKIEHDIKSIAHRIGVVSEEQNLYESFTVFQNIDFFSALYGTARERISEVIDELGLRDKLNDKVRTLSKGLKQRVLLARAIIHRPEFIFLDEPTSGLDPISAQHMHDYLKQIKKNGTTIFLTTHYMDEADLLCDKVAFIDKGKIVEKGTPGELKKKYGTHQIEITYLLDGSPVITTLPLIPSSFDFIKNLGNTIVSIHSKEPTLREIFLSTIKERK